MFRLGYIYPKDAKEMLFNREIVEQCFPDEDIHSYLQNTLTIADLTAEYNILGLYRDETSVLVGCIRYKPFTNRVVEVHPYILPEYQNLGLSRDFMEAYVAWFVHHTTYTHLMSFCAAECKIPIKVFTPLVDCVTIIPKGIKWRNKVQDLYMFTKNIRGWW